MSEEAIADSVVDTEVEVDSGIDMGAAMDDITASIFPDSEEKDDALQQETEGEDAPEKEVAEEKAADVAERLGLPASWKKDMQDKWDGIDPDTQKYFIQREDQMREGLEKDRGDSDLGRVMRDVMSPYSAMLKQNNVDETALVRNLMNAHYRLSTSDDAGRAALMRQFAQSYGVQLDGAPTEQNTEITALTNRLSQMEGHLTASHERTLQDARTRTESEVETFASDHEFFDEVSDEIVRQINAGYDLETAYQNAIQINPVTRQKAQDAITKEAADKAIKDYKEESAKARKAKAANVRGRDTSKTPTEPTGTMEDTMRETFREIQNRP